MPIDSPVEKAVLERKIICACRRGMLELDLILNHFLITKYALLDADERNVFLRMLDSSDLDLLNWIMQKKECPDSSYQLILSLLRSVRHSKIDIT